MTATVVLSVEIELAWGLARIDRPASERHDSDRAAETETLERLLARCDELDVPITFDAVGHLLPEACDGHRGPDDPDAAVLPPDWFDDDPETDVATDPLYYAPDLIERVREADVEHEVGTHTFTHPRCDLADDAVVDWELQAARRAHEEAGLPEPESFVPPMHGPPPADVLRRHGVTGVREPVSLRPPVAPERTDADSTDDLTAAPSDDGLLGDGLLADSPLSGLARRVRESHPVETLARRHPVREPELRDGLVRHYSTWHASLTAPFLPNGTTPPHPAYRYVPIRARQALHERYLRNAIRDAVDADGYVHLWTHLFNASNDAQWPPVRDFLERLAARRDAGHLTVETMGAVSNRVVSARA